MRVVFNSFLFYFLAVRVFYASLRKCVSPLYLHFAVGSFPLFVHCQLFVSDALCMCVPFVSSALALPKLQTKQSHIHIVVGWFRLTVREAAKRNIFIYLNTQLNPRLKCTIRIQYTRTSYRTMQKKEQPFFFLVISSWWKLWKIKHSTRFKDETDVKISTELFQFQHKYFEFTSLFTSLFTLPRAKVFFSLHSHKNCWWSLCVQHAVSWLATLHPILFLCIRSFLFWIFRSMGLCRNT